MVVCFDFDGVLDDIRIQQLSKKFMRAVNEIWIITARKDNEFNRNKMKPVLDKVFISFSNVIFCNDKPKIEILKSINADMYIDNISDEFENIKENTNTIPLLW